MADAKTAQLLELVKTNKVLFYETLFKELGLKTIGEVDDVIIACMRDGLFQGHIDHKERCLFVSSVKIASATPDEIPGFITTLENLSAHCQQGIASIH